jgi:hypothetical protein
MARLLRFEPFDDRPVTVDPGPTEDWRAGHAQGLAEAAAAAQLSEAATAEAALAALGDLAFTWAEARGAVLGALVPFFRALSERLLPDLAADAFMLHLVAELSQSAAADVPPAPGLALAPDDVARVMPLLDAAQLAGIRLTPDPALAPGQARILRGNGGTALDMPALVAALQEVIAAFLAEADTTAPERPETEGQLAHG